MSANTMELVLQKAIAIKIRLAINRVEFVCLLFGRLFGCTEVMLELELIRFVFV